MTKQKSTVEVLFAATAAVPWWVGVTFAAISFASLSWLAGAGLLARPTGPAVPVGMASVVIAALAGIGRVVLPILFLAAALVSGLRQLSSRRTRQAGGNGQVDRTDPWESVPESPTPFPNGPRLPPKRRTQPVAELVASEWNLALIQALDWLRFEELAAGYFEQLGFRARLPAGGADGGIDIHLYWENAATPSLIVQCKAWRARQVGVKEVREFFGVMTSEKVPEGVFVTSGVFSVDAKAFVADKSMHLIDGADLLDKIRALGQAQQQSLLALATKGDFSTPSCPSCRIKLKFRPGKDLDSGFWGCGNYPRCRTKMYSARAA